MSPYLDSQFLLVARTSQDSKEILLSHLSSIQIWLIPVVNDRQATYLSKLRKKTLITTLE
jgi:hypothetical protein